MPGHKWIDVHVGAGKPHQGTGLFDAFLPDLGHGRGQLGFEPGDPLLATVLHVENLRQLLDALVNGVNAKRLQARAVGAYQIVLALAVGRQQVGRDLQFMKLFTGADRALWPDHPLELHRHQFRTLADHRFKTRLVVRQALDLVVLHLVGGQHVVEPQRSGGHLVAQAQAIQHLGASLADGHGAGWRVIKGEGSAAIVDGQRVLRRGGLCEGAQAEAGEQRSEAGQQHEAISI
ncbi:hypothetical protein D3C73_1103650 [compost metagenome]